MNDFLAVAPDAQIAHTALGCMVSVNDLADRPPAPMDRTRCTTFGGRRVRSSTRRTSPRVGRPRALRGDHRHPVLRRPHVADRRRARGHERRRGRRGGAGRGLFLATCLTPGTGPRIRELAALEPTTLAIMHGSSYTGDGAAALRRSPTSTTARRCGRRTRTRIDGFRRRQPPRVSPGTDPGTRSGNDELD